MSSDPVTSVHYHGVLGIRAVRSHPSAPIGPDYLLVPGNDTSSARVRAQIKADFIVFLVTLSNKYT